LVFDPGAILNTRIGIIASNIACDCAILGPRKQSSILMKINQLPFDISGYRRILPLPVETYFSK
jgi:hypothetical protein